MRVEFSFDKTKCEENGYSLENVHDVIKKMYSEMNTIDCVQDDSMLVFEGVGTEHDHARIWAGLFQLLHTDWFFKYAKSCIYKRNNHVEDVLAQAIEKQKIKVG